MFHTKRIAGKVSEIEYVEADLSHAPLTISKAEASS